VAKHRAPPGIEVISRGCGRPQSRSAAVPRPSVVIVGMAGKKQPLSAADRLAAYKRRVLGEDGGGERASSSGKRKRPQQPESRADSKLSKGRPEKGKATELKGTDGAAVEVTSGIHRGAKSKSGGPGFGDDRGNRRGGKRRKVDSVDNKTGKGAKDVGKKGSKKGNVEDPSMKYFANPVRAPICLAARSFFTQTCKLPKFDIVLGRKTGWRVGAKLAVRGNPPVFGMFKPGTHEIAELLHSDAQHPAINEGSVLLHKAALKVGVRGYDGVNPGGLSYVALNADTKHNQVQVVCVFNQATIDDKLRKTSEELLAFIKTAEKADRKKPLLHSFWVHCNPAGRHDNNIYAYDGVWERIWGKEFIEEQLVSLRKQVPYHLPVLRFPPTVFRQANPEAFAGIIGEARKWIQGDATSSKTPVTVELYGGVGTIGLHMLDLVQTISCSDANPHNRICFGATVEGLENTEVRRKVKPYDPRDAVQVVRSGELDRADTVIVDPPRKGLDNEVIRAFVRSRRLQRIVYISCGFKALQRDCASLLEQGFELNFAKGHVLFPGADHIETLAVFSRKR